MHHGAVSGQLSSQKMKNSSEMYKVSISDTCQLPHTLSICSRHFSFFSS